MVGQLCSQLMISQSVAQTLVEAKSPYNSMQSAVMGYLPHFLMFRQWSRLPIDFLFPTHEVMGTLRPVDNYVIELISALKKPSKSHII